jgi:hypothetical protein
MVCCPTFRATKVKYDPEQQAHDRPPSSCTSPQFNCYSVQRGVARLPAGPNETEELDRAPFSLLGVLSDNTRAMTGGLGRISGDARNACGLGIDHQRDD